MNYNLDTEAAKKGSGPTGNRLLEGHHKVKIAQAYEATSTGGAIGVHLDFIDEEKKTGSVDIWTQKKDGNQNDYGMNQINAIMQVAGVQSMNQAPGMITYYDFDSGQDAQKQAQTFPELAGKFMGVIFKKDTYQNQTSGELKPKYEMVVALNFKTNQTALEMLSNNEAEAYTGILDYALKQSEKADLALNNQQSNVTPINQVAAGQDFTPEDDDIPF